VRKIQRLAAVGAMATLTVALAACGSSEAPSTSGATSAPAAPVTSAPAAAPTATNGVTTSSDVFGAACSQLPQGSSPGSLTAMGPQPVATAASTNPLLSTLVTAVKAAGLVDTLNNAQNITVYAPYNGAFTEVQKALGDAKFQALLQDKATLGSILQYHVSGQRYDGAGLIAAGKTTQLAGGDVTVAGTGTGADTKIMLTDGKGDQANVLCGNIPTSNATVFVIDKVLMPKG
jgi:uncharacterized surface protein with fasciclin (FAS1) repeats